ncbi:hypothetical protein GCM10010344_45320 [Streptomyces bluensis]|nr:hypothetical protein GCM10010344_45320 [Streptomyces bluensis]
MSLTDASTQETNAAKHGHDDRGPLVLTHYLSVSRVDTDRDGPVTDCFNVGDLSGFCYEQRPTKKIF